MSSVDEHGMAGEREPHAPITLDLPDIERDGAGIPTFVFKDELPENDKPTRDRKTLEVVLLWREAVMSVGHYDRPGPIRIGEHMKNDFRIASDRIPHDQFPLLDVEGGQFIVNWAEGMTVEVRGEDGTVQDEEALAARGSLSRRRVAADDYEMVRYSVGLHDRVAVQAGDLTFVIQFVSPARIISSGLLKTIDFYFTKVLSLSFLAHLFFVLALLLTPVAPDDLSEDLFKNPNRFAKLLLTEIEEPEPPKKKAKTGGKKSGGKSDKDDGKFGKPEAEAPEAMASVKGAPRIDPVKRERDRKIAQSSGILKALQGAESTAVSQVLGPGGLGTNLNEAMGGLQSNNRGDTGGSKGMGMKGTASGAAGKTLGISGLGDSSKNGVGGVGDVELGGEGRSRFKVTPGRTITKGCLSPQVVGRVIGRNSSRVKYCYEKALQRNPNLGGKVTATFTVGPTGAVLRSNISASTIGDAGVEQCIVRVVRQMRFPPCAGGGTADVTYPWLFKPSGG
ncbi:MAG: AgmX/PglI C-terminal domain-containing protein [Myxococcota bacterium]